MIGVNYNDKNFIFCSKLGHPISTTVARSYFNSIAKKANINNIHPHTFATRGLENGIELKVMQELLGHSSISMTADLYTHILPDKKMDSMMKIAGTINL